MRIPLTQIFEVRRPLIGMVHLLPLPGAPHHDPGTGMAAVIDRAVSDAATLAGAGFDGLVVENYSDVPFYPDRVPAETVAAMAVAIREVVRSTALPVGVNLLRNDGEGAVAIAHATGARFVRINVLTGVLAADQGLLTGRAHEVQRLRARLGSNVAVFADVWVKHATPFPGSELEQMAEDTYARGLADALIVTGSGTGKATDLSRVDLVRRGVPDAPVLVGSGVTVETVQDTLAVADGAIVGSVLCRDGAAGRGVDPDRAAALVQALARKIVG